MLKNFLQKIIGDQSNKKLKEYWPIVYKINDIHEKYKSEITTKEHILNKTKSFQEYLKRELDYYEKEVIKIEEDIKKADEEENLEKKKYLAQTLTEKKEKLYNKEQELLAEILPEAFALVKRTCEILKGEKFEVRGKIEEWFMVPFDVQLLGGIVLHSGKIAEMKTGEGKTLVATMPLYLNALTKKGAFLVTVNDYLAQRDSEWMGFLYKNLGLSVGVITNGMDISKKQAEYEKDILYGTNNEFGFDYLRDNMVYKKDDITQKNLNYVIIDEVDSILVDEARTPLIISAPDADSSSKYKTYHNYVSNLKEEADYIIDEKMKTATLTDEGIKHLEKLMNVDNIYTEAGFSAVHHIEQALKAKACYKKDKDYIIKNDEVLIVDEFTGRVLDGRRYSDGLHQAIEAKENVSIKQESTTLATITFQNYFRMFRKISGMTGTAKTEEEEFIKIYGLEVMELDTNKPVIREDLDDVIYKTVQAKFDAVADTIEKKYKKGQPVLVGTTSVEKSEYLSSLLKKRGVPHNVLNAKYHEQEADIVSRAGNKNSITIATNMAGRGTDIKLGEGVVDLGGLAVIGTERHEARRIDNQLRGRSGRSGDPGESQFFVSLQDDLMRIFGGEKVEKMMGFLHIPDNMPIENKMISNMIESSQKKVEGYHFDIRKHVLEYDDVMNKHRDIIYSKRKKILFKDNIKDEIIEMLRQYITGVVNGNYDIQTKNLDKEKIIQELNLNLFLDDENVKIDLIQDINDDYEISDKLFDYARDIYNKKRELVKHDEEKYNLFEKNLYLKTIDVLWLEHIKNMQGLRESVSLKGYGQRDPLIEYKKDAYDFFLKLLSQINSNALKMIYRVKIKINEQVIQNSDIQNIETNKDDIEKNLYEKNLIQNKVIKSQGPIKSNKTPRNAPCPCGSGKKYKHCCGKDL